LSKPDVRDVGIQAYFLAFEHIGPAMIITVRSKKLPFEIIFRKSDLLQILLRPITHRWDMSMVLAIAKGFSMEDHLMLLVRQGLAIVTLQRPMPGRHHRRFIIRDVALDLLADGP